MHVVPSYAAVVGTWWIKIVSERLKLPVYMYNVCAHTGDEIAVVCVPYQNECTNQWVHYVLL